MVAVGVAAAAQVVVPLVGASAERGPSVPASAAPVEGQVYVVQPGDTLWTVAAAVAPESDPRPIVDRLRDVNGAATLDVGDRLVIDLD
jgi:hypothetical protein